MKEITVNGLLAADPLTMDIPKQYDPKQAEQDHYQRWEKQGCFAPEINHDPNAPAFSIVIPPPNVTGSLHMGHALQHTMMDVLTRYKRMCGYRTLWLPGMDHAGISTQLMVIRELKKEGLTRHDLGREKFVERVWKWKKESGGKLPNSCVAKAHPSIGRAKDLRWMSTCRKRYEKFSCAFTKKE